jgi:hypothetical protein
MSPTVQSIVISFLVLFVAFRLLELSRPRQKRLPVLRRGFWTDLVYWAFTPLVTRVVTGAGVASRSSRLPMQSMVHSTAT